MANNPTQADREQAAERLDCDVPAGELERIENAATVARFLVEACMKVESGAKANDVIPVAARIYASALDLSEAATAVAVEREAREVRTARIQAEMAAQREAARREKAEEAAREAKAAVLEIGDRPC